MNWSKPVNDTEAHRRAGGRRRYNAERQHEMNYRRFVLLPELMLAPDRLTYTDIARRLGVSRTTLYRDLEALKMWRDVGLCRVCGQQTKNDNLGLSLKVIRDVNNRLSGLFSIY